MYTTIINWRNVVAIVICSAVLILSAACDETSEEIVKDADITVSNKNDLKQAAYADEPTTGNGISFTAKDAWSANVKANGGCNASWVKLTINGVETYSGSAGTYTLVITVETNYSGAKREATVEIICGTDRITVTVAQEGTTKGGDKPGPIELKSPIRENTTLKDLGLPVDYIYTSDNQLVVENNATLTIEPGVTIQFTNSGRRGGLIVKANSTIKAIGTASNRIQFIGTNNEQGSWQGMNLESNTDNQFVYCDFLNAGSQDRSDGAALILINGAKAGISQSKFTNGKGHALIINDYGGVCQISAFNNNVMEGYELSPVYIYTGNLKQLEKFDMTSELSNNKQPYIDTRNPYINENVTLNQTTVPYNITSTMTLRNTLTLNAGITIYMADGHAITGDEGRLMINGTADKKVKFTRKPDAGLYYWGFFSFSLPGSVIKHCILEYGGKNATSGMILILSNANLTLDNVAINNSNTYGVVFGANHSGYIVNHSNVTFSNNRDGNVYNGTTKVVRNNL